MLGSSSLNFAAQHASWDALFVDLQRMKEQGPHLLVRRSSMTAATYNAKNKSKTIPLSWKYATITTACTHGVKDRQRPSTRPGAIPRLKQRYRFLGCPVKMTHRAVASFGTEVPLTGDDIPYVVVTDITCAEHNHMVSASHFATYACNRVVSDPEIISLMPLLSAGPGACSSSIFWRH